jgi:hypothetical protein
VLLDLAAGAGAREGRLIKRSRRNSASTISKADHGEVFTIGAKRDFPLARTLVGVIVTRKFNAFPACRVLQIAATIIH